MTRPNPFDRTRVGAPATTQESIMASTYMNLRAECIGLEEQLAALQNDSDEFSGHDLSELDKAVTVMKVGFKLMKRVLKKHGYTNLKERAQAQRA